MEAIILEIRYKHQQQAIYMRPQGSSISMGRGFANTIILDDPFVSAHHAQLELDAAGQWQLTDQHSDNGTLYQGSKIEQTKDIHLGESFTMGDTTLRLIAATTAVAATHIRQDVQGYVAMLSQARWSWLLTIVLTAAWLLLSDIRSSDHFDAQSVAMAGAVMLFTFCLWAGFWAWIGKTLKKRTAFHLQLSVMVLFSLLLELLDVVISYVEYMLSSQLVAQILSYTLNVALSALLLYVCLWIATHRSKLFKMVFSLTLSIGLGVFMLSAQWMVEGYMGGNRDVSTVLKPPYAMTLPAVSMEQYFTRNAQLLGDIALE
ncbi:MAG: FHA domain-containing protein [Mariprofundaceae bacterium]|nr:FHA domain-containing protein [Mariprofundaceae bacterium]